MKGKPPVFLVDTNVWLDNYLGFRPNHRTSCEFLDEALAQGAARDDDILALEVFGLGKDFGRGILVKHKLQNAGGVPQIGKDDAAFITGAGDRTADGHLPPDIGQTHLGAVIGTAQVAHCFHDSQTPFPVG